jgi:Zn/Cd-binding protein ZinT
MEIQIFNFTGYEKECEIMYFDGKGKYLKTLFITNLDLTLYHNQKREEYKVTINSIEAIQFDKNSKGVPYLLDDFELFEIQHEMVGYIDWVAWEENRLVDDNFLD